MGWSALINVMLWVSRGGGWVVEWVKTLEILIQKIMCVESTSWVMVGYRNPLHYPAYTPTLPTGCHTNGIQLSSPPVTHPTTTRTQIFVYLTNNVLQFSVPQIEYPLSGSSKKVSHVYFLLQVFWVILLFDINVVLMLPW